jgi:hypothetical protein
MSDGLDDIVCISALTKPNTYFIIRDNNTEVEIELRPYCYKSSHNLYDIEKQFVKTYLLVAKNKYQVNE